jgi:hypothetical protein
MLNAPEIAGIALAGATATSVAVFRVEAYRRALSTESRAMLLGRRLDDVSGATLRAVAERGGVSDELEGAVEAYLQASRTLEETLLRRLRKGRSDEDARGRLLWAAAADLHVVGNLSVVEASGQQPTDEVRAWLDELGQDGLLPETAIELLGGDDPTAVLLEIVNARRDGVLPQIYAGLLALSPIAGGADTPLALASTCAQVSEQIVTRAGTTLTRLVGNTIWGAETHYIGSLLSDAATFATTGDTRGGVHHRTSQLILHCLKRAQAKLHELIPEPLYQAVPLNHVLEWLGEHWQPFLKLRSTLDESIFRLDELQIVCDELVAGVPEAEMNTRKSALEAVGVRHKGWTKRFDACAVGLRLGSHSAALHPPVLAAVGGLVLLIGGLTMYSAQDHLDWPRTRFLPDTAKGVVRTLGGHRSDSGEGYPKDRTQTG